MAKPNFSAFKAWWKLNEASGNRSESVQGAAYLTLTDNNSVLSATGRHWRSPLRADFVPGNSESLSCETAYNSLVSAGANSSISFGLWIQPHEVGTHCKILAKWDGTDNEYTINITNSKIRFSVRDATNTTTYSVDADRFGVLKNNEEYFVSAYYDYSTYTIGVAVNNIWDTSNGPSNGLYNSSVEFYLGSWGALTDYYNGYIDNVFVYGGLLSDDEFTWLYNYGYGRSFEDVEDADEVASDVVSREYGADQLVEILDSDLLTLGFIDDYISLIWTERFKVPGDFELQLPLTYFSDSRLDLGNFLRIRGSEVLMVIEDKKPETTESEKTLLLNGRSIDILFDRRDIETPIVVSGPADWSIFKVVYDNVVNPENADRAMLFFNNNVYERALISDEWYSEDFSGVSVLQILKDICEATDLGYKVIRGDDNKLYFYIYIGTDRSTSQTENDPVIFANILDNLENESYVISSKDKVNVVLVVATVSSGGNESEEKFYVWEAPTIIPSVNLLNDLSAWWRLEELSGTRYDAHTNNLHLTAVNSPGYGQLRQGYAVDLEFSSNQYLYRSSGLDALKPDGSFSVGGWIRPESNDADINLQVIAAVRQTNPDASSFCLRRRTTNSQIEFFIAYDTSWSSAVNSTELVNVGETAFVVAVYDANVGKLYLSVNGSPFDVASIGDVTINQVTTEFTLGTRGEGASKYSHFDGMLDEFFFYKDRVLNISEVQWLYNNGYGRTYSDISSISSYYKTDIDRFERVIEIDVNKDEVDPPLTDIEVYEVMLSAGLTELKEKKVKNVYDGEFNIFNPFAYGQDFFIGDIVQCVFEDLEVKAQVIELVRTFNSEGERAYVTVDYIE